MKKNKIIQQICGWICFALGTPAAVMCYDELRNVFGLDGIFHTVEDYNKNGLYRDLDAFFIILGGFFAFVMYTIWLGVLIQGTPEEHQQQRNSSYRPTNLVQPGVNHNSVKNKPMTAREQQIFMEEFDRYQQSATHQYFENMKK